MHSEVAGLDNGVDGEGTACLALTGSTVTAMCDKRAGKEAVCDCFAGTATCEGLVGNRLGCHGGNWGETVGNVFRGKRFQSLGITSSCALLK
jgi:hypothetical protein